MSPWLIALATAGVLVLFVALFVIGVCVGSTRQTQRYGGRR